MEGGGSLLIIADVRHKNERRHEVCVPLELARGCVCVDLCCGRVENTNGGEETF